MEAHNIAAVLTAVCSYLCTLKAGVALYKFESSSLIDKIVFIGMSIILLILSLHFAGLSV